MENRIVFVEINDGSLVPLNMVQRIFPEKTETTEGTLADAIKIKSEKLWMPSCADGTFARSLRFLNITDSRVYWTRFRDKTNTEAK